MIDNGNGNSARRKQPAFRRREKQALCAGIGRQHRRSRHSCFARL